MKERTYLGTGLAGMGRGCGCGLGEMNWPRANNAIKLLGMGLDGGTGQRDIGHGLIELDRRWKCGL